jgi:hypothetical protein
MMRKTVIVLLAGLLILPAAYGQKKGGSPTDAVMGFYQELKQKKYVEGFRLSIYKSAVEGLTEAELKELEPDFARAFSTIPEKIEPRGEQITGDTAVVFLKFEGIEQPQQVGLVRVDGDWLVGEKSDLDIVRSQGRQFFFNTRMSVNESEANEMLGRVIGAELIYSRKFEGRFASLEELIKLGGVPKDIEDHLSSGYRFTLTVSQDQRAFFAVAVPTLYGKTGRISFYADLTGVRGEDLKGQPATAKSPIYQPK